MNSPATAMSDTKIKDTRALISVEVVRGTSGFADACRIAAVSLAMAACAHAAAEPLKVLKPRPRVVPTEASVKLRTLLSDQKPHAEPVSPEQWQTLEYGIYPPVKTTVQINGKLQTHWTLHPFDLVHLARDAAKKASSIEGITVDPAKVGAIMIAESSLVARTGWSANGKTASYGLGQLEMNTARALGVLNPNDPRDNALAVARLVAQALKFSRSNNFVDPRLTLSLAYNTSTSLRKSLVAQYGRALRIENLPVATQIHVKNMAYGEGRMTLFAKLCDQHEKITQTLTLTQAPTIYPPKETAMTTAHTPSPSIKALLSNLVSDNANQARLKHNQTMLERAGHIAAIPMTAKGLSDLRLAISDHSQRLGESSSDKGSTFRNLALDLSASVMLSKVGQDVMKVATSMTGKVREVYAKIQAEMLTASNVESPSPSKTTSGLQAANKSASSFMSGASAQLQQLRDRIREAQAHHDRENNGMA